MVQRPILKHQREIGRIFPPRNKINGRKPLTYWPCEWRSFALILNEKHFKQHISSDKHASQDKVNGLKMLVQGEFYSFQTPLNNVYLSLITAHSKKKKATAEIGLRTSAENDLLHNTTLTAWISGHQLSLYKNLLGSCQVSSFASEHVRHPRCQGSGCTGCNILTFTMKRYGRGTAARAMQRSIQPSCQWQFVVSTSSKKTPYLQQNSLQESSRDPDWWSPFKVQDRRE